jgi:hypothetical protein
VRLGFVLIAGRNQTSVQIVKIIKQIIAFYVLQQILVEQILNFKFVSKYCKLGSCLVYQVRFRVYK